MVNNIKPTTGVLNQSSNCEPSCMGFVYVTGGPEVPSTYRNRFQASGFPVSRKTAYSKTVHETTKTNEKWETLADEFAIPDTEQYKLSTFWTLEISSLCSKSLFSSRFSSYSTLLRYTCTSRFISIISNNRQNALHCPFRHPSYARCLRCS